MKKNLPLRLIISVGAVAFIVVRMLWPSLQVDAVTLGLVIVAILPWLSSIIESAEFPGGWKVKFREVKAAGEKITREAPREPTEESLTETSYLAVAEQDPNLALVGLRIEIEKRLRDLAQQHGLPERKSISRLLGELREHGVLAESSVSGLQELVHAGNQAAHGALVEGSVATWAIEYGPGVLEALDAKLDATG